MSQKGCWTLQQLFSIQVSKINTAYISIIVECYLLGNNNNKNKNSKNTTPLKSIVRDNGVRQVSFFFGSNQACK